MTSLESLIEWTNRHKGTGSVLFAETGERPSLTAVIDYHHAGAPGEPHERDPLARHGKHRASYAFPLAREWKTWAAICASERGIEQAELGEFIETNAMHLIQPTPAMLGQGAPVEAWEQEMIETAAKLQGRFGSYQSIVRLARELAVHETSNIQASVNRDTGETSIQFMDQHSAPDGSPINIPNLFLIAIPVFDRGPCYRLAVRLRYRKSGQAVKFILSIYGAEAAREDAIKEALTKAATDTCLPVFEGTPEKL